MLCKLCKDFDYDQLISEGGYKHHEDCEQLCLSAEAGCSICDLAMREGGEQWMKEEDQRIICKLSDTDLVQWHHGDTLRSILQLCTTDDDPLATLFESRPVFESALSAGCIEMMTGWMKRCKVEHKSCPRQIEQPLPTRVIDVEPSNGKVRLFVSNGRSGQWAALSHCWGEVQPVKTIKTNFDIHCQKGLDLASLTPTFRNAIILTRRLGIPYIWINSLCIIQNNSAD